MSTTTYVFVEIKKIINTVWLKKAPNIELCSFLLRFLNIPQNMSKVQKYVQSAKVLTRQCQHIGFGRNFHRSKMATCRFFCEWTQMISSNKFTSVKYQYNTLSVSEIQFLPVTNKPISGKYNLDTDEMTCLINRLQNS